MSVKNIASMSHMLAPNLSFILLFISLFYFFSTMKYVFDHIRKNISYNIECENDIGKKMVGLEVIHFQKIV